MADLTVKAVIELILKGGGLPKDVEDRLRKLQAQAKQTQSGFNEFSASLSKLGAALGLSFGAAQAISFLRTAFVEFAKTERALNALNNQIKNLGQASRLSRADVSALVSRLSDQFGILDDDLIPALNRLVLGLGDVDQAQRALEISAKFAANGFGDVESNAAALAIAMQSGTLRSLRQFGVETEDASGKAVSFADGIKQLIEINDRLSNSLDDPQAKLDRLSNKFDKLKDSIAGALNEFLNATIAFEESTAAEPTIPEGAASIRDPNRRKPKDPLEEAANAKAAGDAKKKADDAAAQAAKKQIEFEDKLQAEVQDTTNAYKEQTRASIAAATDANIQKLADEAKVQEESAARTKKFLEDRAGLERDLQERLFAASLQLAADNIDAQQKLETDALKEKHDREMAAAKALNADLAALQKTHTAEDLALRKKHEKAKDDLRKADSIATAQSAENLASLAVELLTTVFGQNKALAIAAAIINTAQAVTRTLAEGGAFAIPAAALVAAIGAAQVAKIASTNPSSGGDTTAGRGFDDPIHDRLARMGGRRWAEDQVREITLGLSEGFAEATRGALATGGSRDVHIHVNAPIIGSERQMARKLYRLVKEGQKADRSRESF